MASFFAKRAQILYRARIGGDDLKNLPSIQGANAFFVRRIGSGQFRPEASRVCMVSDMAFSFVRFEMTGRSSR